MPNLISVKIGVRGLSLISELVAGTLPSNQMIMV